MEAVSNTIPKKNKKTACRGHRAVITAVFTVLHTCGCMQRLLWCVLVITTGWLVSVYVYHIIAVLVAPSTASYCSII